jgi:hypothetical protein
VIGLVHDLFHGDRMRRKRKQQRGSEYKFFHFVFLSSTVIPAPRSSRGHVYAGIRMPAQGGHDILRFLS